VERELREAAVRRDLRESERARAQERIERELVSKQLEIIRSLGNDILLIISRDGRIVEANDRAVAAYGYTLDELLRLDGRELRAEGSRAEFLDQIRAAVEQGGGRYRTWHRRRSGERFPVAVSARPIEVAGQVLLQSIIRDLTEEEAARAAIDREALLLAHLHDAVIGLDRALRVNAWNRAAERLFGLARDEALGRPLRGLVETELAGGRILEDVARAAQERGSTRVEVRQRARSGGTIDGELTVVALRDAGGELLGYVAVLRDITLQKRAEAALRESQERLARVLETSNEGIWIVDVEGRTEFVNRQGAELLGVPQERLVGRSFLEVLPGATPAVAAEELAAIRRGESGRRELGHVRPDGQRLHLVYSRSVLRAPGVASAARWRSSWTSRRSAAPGTTSSTPRRWRRSGGSRAASRTTSTTSSWRS
jgi:PAS domain S-box-containing protein